MTSYWLKSSSRAVARHTYAAACGSKSSRVTSGIKYVLCFEYEKKEKESLRRRTHSWHVLFIFFLSKEKTYFQAKRLAVIQTEYLTDKIIIKVRKQGYFYSFLTSKFPGILLPVPVRVQILELLTPSVHYYIEHGYGRLIRRKWDSGTRIIAACKVKRGLGGVA